MKKIFYIVAIIIIISRLTLWSLFIIDGPSMCPTLNCEKVKGQQIIFSLKTQNINRFDIIIFKNPNDESRIIKRVIGLPNETIHIQNNLAFHSTQHEKFNINEPYETFNIPEKSYFVMGDNRNNSADSRNCFNPSRSMSCHVLQSHYITTDDIYGKAMFSVWPPAISL